MKTKRKQVIEQLDFSRLDVMPIITSWHFLANKKSFFCVMYVDGVKDQDELSYSIA
jgi:hypothetical protein